ncbi:unnamed protein product [Linum tenue]|uniref:Uncharacterized protein n=1 Tax=Linum tenue TaxID=586396 RepID=A0AAV0IWH5_9ROSI|nr:unnamed protein product [Linum tenue]
MVRVGFFPSNR